MKNVVIYTDGACSGNPGPGGWGAVLIYGGSQREICGGEQNTTNQRMELMAAAEALSALKEPCQVQLFSDSAYLINGFNQRWVAKWQRNGWLNVKKQPVKNQELWQRLAELAEKHQVTWNKVKGHDGVDYNERCDALARGAIAK